MEFWATLSQLQDQRSNYLSWSTNFLLLTDEVSEFLAKKCWNEKRAINEQDCFCIFLAKCFGIKIAFTLQLFN